MTDVETTPVECPSCGRVSRIDPAARSRDEFCAHCDYPLFWAVEPSGANAVDAGEGRRRLPGMTGVRTIGALSCPTCTEPNRADVEHCVRCGAVLRPEPIVTEEVVVVEAVPEPEPEWIRPPIGSMVPIYLMFLLVPSVVLLVLLAVVV